MPEPLKQWKVLPHGKLTSIDSNLWSVAGEIHIPVTFPRRMTVVRLEDRRLVVYNAIALDESEMDELESYGPPAFLIVPNDHHRLDAKVWKDRYPQIQVIAPEGSRAKVEEVVAVDTIAPSFNDPNVQFVVVPGTRGHEAALVVNNPSGTTIVLNDLVANIKETSGFRGWLLRMIGFAGPEPKIPRPVKMALIKDTDAVRAQLLEWARIESLARILVSHGDPIDENPRQTLRELASSLRSSS